MAEITSVTSEALQAEIRRLLPSQQGFGQDLQASNVITPIIDLTGAADGSSIGTNLQTALAFGSQTTFDVTNTTTVILNTGGFYRITANMFATANLTNTLRFGFTMSDGSTTKNIYTIMLGAGFSGATSTIPNVDLIVFLRSGDSVSATSPATSTNVSGSTRQIADINGNLINPVGFTPT